MSPSQDLIKRMTNLSLTEDYKTRHESKLAYRKDHPSPRPSRAVEQKSLPSTFSPTPLEHLWKEKLATTQYNVTETGVGESYYKPKVIFP